MESARDASGSYAGATETRPHEVTSPLGKALCSHSAIAARGCPGRSRRHVSFPGWRTGNAHSDAIEPEVVSCA